MRQVQGGGGPDCEEMPFLCIELGRPKWSI
jgi:hypothetical protein